MRRSNAFFGVPVFFNVLRFKWLLIGLLAIYAMGSAAEDNRAGCDSCRFQVESLDQPFSVIGTWLFSRDDLPQNSAVETDTTAWKIIKVPGVWQTAYGDGKNFSVGWYRGVFEFAPALIGQEVVFLVDAYMGRVSVYLDGQAIYHRPGEINIERYYSIQPIPVRFKITQARQTIAIRVDTPLMKGIYQLPFELRRYDAHDTSLSWYQFKGGEARLIASYAALFFGLFFLMVYWKTRYPLYLVAALNTLIVIPFFAAPGDNLLRVYEPERLFYLHYPGLLVAYTSYLFSQFFYKSTPRLNKILGVVSLTLAGIIASFSFHPNLDLFQKLRGVYLILMNVILIGSSYMLIRAALQKKAGALILLAGSLTFVFTAVHDTLLALGRIDSVAVLFLGTLTLTAATLFVASSIFANTFLENRTLVRTLKGLNDNLEGLVAERTEKLSVALEDLGSANNNLKSSYEQLSEAKDQLVRSEKLAALGSLVAGISHELNTPLGNGLMATSTLVDQMNALKTEMAEKGPRKSSFEAFLSTVEASADITWRSLNRSANLVSSFKKIAVDQAVATRGQFSLVDLIKDVVIVAEPNFKGKPFTIETDIPDGIELDSYSDPLAQVVESLISNAIIHGFEGRGHGTVRISAQASGDGRLKICVKDDGKGIADEHLSKIFDPFFTTTLGQGGSGLGLHIAHNIVTQVLGGDLNVTTQIGSGSEFVIDIPLSAPVTVKS
jgi:signal transduction histidine kinase